MHTKSELACTVDSAMTRCLKPHKASRTRTLSFARLCTSRSCGRQLMQHGSLTNFSWKCRLATKLPVIRKVFPDAVGGSS